MEYFYIVELVLLHKVMHLSTSSTTGPSYQRYLHYKYLSKMCWINYAWISLKKCLINPQSALCRCPVLQLFEWPNGISLIHFNIRQPHKTSDLQIFWLTNFMPVLINCIRGSNHDDAEEKTFDMWPFAGSLWYSPFIMATCWQIACLISGWFCKLTLSILLKNRTQTLRFR